MTVDFKVSVKGIPYSESVETVSKLEKDGEIEIGDDLRETDDDDIGSLRSAKKPDGEIVDHPGIRAVHFTESHRRGEDTEGLQFYYYEEMTAMTDHDPSFEGTANTLLVLSNIADKLEDKYGDKVSKTIQESQG